MTSNEPKLSLLQKLLYSAPTFAGAAIAIPLLIHLPKFYSDVVLVPIGYIALAIAIARALDAMVDPAIGWLSDRTHTRLGRRRPYLLIGAPFCAVALYLMLSPPESLEPAQAGVWFGVTFALYFFFHAIYEIPYLGMGAELTVDYHERSSLYGWRTAFLISGTFFASVLPVVLAARGPRGAMAATGTMLAVLLVVLYALLVVGVRERRRSTTHAANALVPGVRVAVRNRPFMILFLTLVVASLPAAIPALMLPYYTDYVIDPADTQKTVALFLVLYFGTSFFCVPLWVWAAHRFGKLHAWLASFMIGISAGIGLFFVGKGDVAWVAVLHVWAGIAFGAGFLLFPAMQADVIDYDELHTGQRREAQFTAFWALVPKLVAIPGAALPIALLAQLGYVPNQDQSPTVLLGIRVIYALVPAACATVAFFLGRQYNVSQQVHEKIRAGIAAHARGENAVDPLTGRVIPPPSARLVDPDTAWFLDHFSPGELRRVIAQGAAGLRGRVAAKAGACLALSIAAVGTCIATLPAVHEEPGLLPVLSVVTAGFALTGAAFHALRLGPAARMAARPVAPELLRAHLEQTARTLPPVGSAAEALQRAS
ncbi:MAG TPA: MFS transporter [Myxococcota bacterium]|nr:MFS transporter [Myxococcota bacterium]